MMNKIKQALKNPYRILVHLIKGRARFLSDKTYLNILYRACFGKPINWENPRTFNEKLQWLKIHDRNPLYTKLVDKYEVKKYVAERIGEEHVIPTLGVWNRFDDINFDTLPQQFVLKCTHDSGGLVIVPDKDKLDKEAARKKIEASLKRNYYWKSREWPYKNVKPRIIAEKYMTDGDGQLNDYKIHNFNGCPKVVLTCRDRFAEAGLTEDFFTADWKRLDISRPFTRKSEEYILKPENLEEMIRIAKELSKEIPFVRTDFYSVGDKTYVGELTFYPASGMKGFVPEEWDGRLGEWLVLPDKVGGVILKGNHNCYLYLHSEYNELKDYKLFCFNGKVHYLYIASDRNTPGEEVKFDYFDREFNRLPLRQEVHPNSSYDIKKPENYDEMVALAEKLSAGLPQVRMDFYDINGKIYFGEFTFFHTGGFVPFIPEKYDWEWGGKMNLSQLMVE